MKNRTSCKMNQANKKLMDQLIAVSIYPKKTHIRQWGLQWFLPTHQTSRKSIQKRTTPHAPVQHCQNGNTFKNHFIVILSGVAKQFPMHLWDCLLLQTETMLNMVQATNMKPWVSVHTYMNGQHDYNRMPLAPLGCHTMAYNKPEKRTSWGPKASKRFYISTSTEHCRCFKIWMKDTWSICISDTVNFCHKFITAPRKMQDDKITATAKNLVMVLLITKLVQINETDKQALTQLTNIFATMVNSKNQATLPRWMNLITKHSNHEQARCSSIPYNRTTTSDCVPKCYTPSPPPSHHKRSITPDLHTQCQSHC